MSNATTYATPAEAIAAHCATPQDERHELECFIWDEYKSINGIRPRWMNFQAMTLEELRAEANSLGEETILIQKRAAEFERETVRLANAKALAKRKFDQNFNSLGNALILVKI